MFDLRFQLEVLSSEALLGGQVCLESTAATFKEDIHGGFLWTIKAYMQKTCDVAEKAILAKKKLRKKCVNRDIM